MFVTSDWRFIAASTNEIRRWSCGAVRQAADLYSAAIFGPSRDDRCECGKYHDPRFSGMICDECGVAVAHDAERLRMRRMGHVELAFPCRHPLDGREVMDCWPVAPIDYRLHSGDVTGLGRKYEALLAANAKAAGALPDAGSEAYYRALIGLDTSILDEAIADLLGTGPDPSDQTLIRLLERSLRALSPGTAAVVRSCGLAIEAQVTL